MGRVLVSVLVATRNSTGISTKLVTETHYNLGPLMVLAIMDIFLTLLVYLSGFLRKELVDFIHIWYSN